MKCGVSYKESVQNIVSFSDNLTVFERFDMIFTHTPQGSREATQNISKKNTPSQYYSLDSTTQTSLETTINISSADRLLSSLLQTLSLSGSSQTHSNYMLQSISRMLSSIFHLSVSTFQLVR
jgi:hypothetical protein